MSSHRTPESTVSAKDFQRQPGRYQRLAQAQPVTITAHGEPSLVIMSVREYERLKRRDRQVLVVDELSADEADELLTALKESAPTPEAAKFDKELAERKA
ncbi:MAG TPA: prevent-host-death protein [Hyphomonadaceae bacterium]|nr:prevent-host-death protein [Hyphomonadaceae bacterium]